MNPAPSGTATASHSETLVARWWWTVPLLVLILSAISDLRQVQRVLHAASLGESRMEVDPSSPTGYTGGQRQLLIPEKNVESYQLIALTQQMLAEGSLDVRRTSMDNWPEGREVHSPSPYRWWLALIAWVNHVITDKPVGASVETAALLAGPLLKTAALLGFVLFTARHFGPVAAMVSAVGWIGWFPFSASFLPAQPGVSQGARVLALATVMLLVAALAGRNSSIETSRLRRLFVLSGIAGACGLWLSVQVVYPLIVAIGVGALITPWFVRADSANPGARLPWMSWGWSGTITTLLACAIEQGLGQPQLRVLDFLHPLYAVSWLGLSLVVDAVTRIHAGGTARTKATWFRLALGTAGFLALPVTLRLGEVPGFLSAEPLDHRLHGLAESPVASSFPEWISQVHASAGLAVSLLPLLAGVLCCVVLWRTSNTPRSRTALLVGMTTLGVAALAACFRLRWWETAGLLTLPLLALAGSTLFRNGVPPSRKRVWLVSLGLLFLPGSLVTLSSTWKVNRGTVTEKEAEALMERHLARWLQQRMGESGARILASPELSASLSYYGGVKVLASPYRENQAGFKAAARIASATLPDEAQALASGRELTHILLASWSPSLNTMGRLGPRDGQAVSLVEQLETWMPPRWLRPLAYPLPQMEGLPAHSLAVFEVVELQDQSTALARLAEYFAEMGEMNAALSVVGTLLHHFPDDLGGSAARAQVAMARRDKAEFTEAVRVLTLRYAQDHVNELAWDRRASIALVLAQSGRREEARATVQACLADADELNFRSASPASLYRFLTLVNALGLDFEDPVLRRQALQMLTPEMQDALAGLN